MESLTYKRENGELRMEYNKQKYWDLVRSDFRRLIPNAVFIFKILPKKALSWSLKMFIALCQILAAFFLVISLGYGIYEVWSWMWTILHKVMIIVGIITIVILIIVSYHENIERRLKKKLNTQKRGSKS